MSARSLRLAQRALALVAIVFGLATLLAGGRVLLGSDPGYVVYRPLLAYNTAMGMAYVAAGLLAWANVGLGKYVAAAIFLLNALALAGTAWLYSSGAAVARESVAAMGFRTVVWLLLFAGMAWVSRRRDLSSRT